MSWPSQVPDLEIPPFVSVGGGSVGPGFLGMTYAPFVVGSNGDVRNLNMGIEPGPPRCSGMQMLGLAGE